MKKSAFIAAAVVMVLSAPAVLAVDEHHPDQKDAPTKAAPTEIKTPAAMDGGMPMMQENMLKMHDTMHKIMQAKDPKERERLMQEHRQAMQENMKMMRGMMAGPGGGTMGPGMMGGPKGPGPGAQQMSTMTHDMADQMVGMSGEMSKGNLSAAQQKQMSERMRKLATMMDDMSGMMGKGMMPDPEMQKRMEQMRKQMDGMMKGPPMQ